MGLGRTHRTGPEFSQPGRGTYQPEQIPLTTAGLAATDLKPAAVAGLLRDAVTEDRDLFTLPDLRSAPSRNYRAGAEGRRSRCAGAHRHAGESAAAASIVPVAYRICAVRCRP